MFTLLDSIIEKIIQPGTFHSCSGLRFNRENHLFGDAKKQKIYTDLK